MGVYPSMHWADPPGQTHPSLVRHPPGKAPLCPAPTAADGTHPTGMHSRILRVFSLDDVCFIPRDVPFLIVFLIVVNLVNSHLICWILCFVFISVYFGLHENFLRVCRPISETILQFSPFRQITPGSRHLLTLKEIHKDQITMYGIT